MSALSQSFVCTIASAVVALLSVVNQGALAYCYGASQAMDLYVLAGSLPNLIAGLIGSSLNYTLVRFLAENTSSKLKYREVASALLILTLSFGIALSILGNIVTVQLAAGLGASLGLEAETKMYYAMYIFWYYIPPLIASEVLRAVCYLKGSYLLPILSAAIPHIASIPTAVILAQSKNPSIVPIVVANLSGNLFVLCALWLSCNKDICFKRISLETFRKIQKFGSTIPAVAIAMMCFTAFQTIDSYWSSRLSTGELAHLGYTQRIIVAIGTVIITGPAAILNTRLSVAATEGNRDSFLEATKQALQLVLATAVPTLAFLATFAETLVSFLFSRGKFDGESVVQVAGLFRTMVIGMVPMLCATMLYRAIFARRDLRLAVFLGILTPTLYFTLSGLLTPRYGVNGVAISYVCTWAIVTGTATIAIWRSTITLNAIYKTLIYILKLAMIAVVINRSVEISQHLVPTERVAYKSFTLTALQIVQTLIITYLLGARLLKIPQLEQCFSHLKLLGSFARKKREPL